MDTFINERSDGVLKVADATQRLALVPTDGFLVEQLDNNTLWAWHEPTATWVPFAGSGGVTDINGLVGSITLAAGANISLTPVGNTITIAATGVAQNNFVATVNPTPNDDSGDGYSVGSLWFNRNYAQGGGSLWVAITVGVGTANWQPVRNAVMVNGAPTVNDDDTQGYFANFLWFDLNTNALYWCFSNTTGAAVWIAVASVQVQADYTETNSASPSFIQNLYVTQSTSADGANTITAASSDVNFLNINDGTNDIQILDGFNTLEYDNIIIAPDPGVVVTVLGTGSIILFNSAFSAYPAVSITLNGDLAEYISVRWDAAFGSYIQNGGKFRQIIDIFYFDLQTFVSNGQLVPGQQYRIIDFQSVFRIPGQSDRIIIGPLDHLIVIAATESSLETQVWSDTNPEDIIYYNMIDNTANRPAAFTYSITPSVSSPNYTYSLATIPLTNFSISNLVLNINSSDQTVFSTLQTFADHAALVTYIQTFFVTETITYDSLLDEMNILSNSGDIYGDLDLNNDFISKGRILYRKDVERNIETYYDFRAVQFYRPYFDYDLSTVSFPVTPVSIEVNGSPVDLTALDISGVVPTTTIDEFVRFMTYGVFPNNGIFCTYDTGTQIMRAWSTNGFLLGDLIVTDTTSPPDVTITPTQTDQDYYTFGNRIYIPAYDQLADLTPAADGNQLNNINNVSIGMVDSTYWGTSFANIILGEYGANIRVGSNVVLGTIGAFDVTGGNVDIDLGSDAFNFLIGTQVNLVEFSDEYIDIVIMRNSVDIQLGNFASRLFFEESQNIIIGQSIQNMIFPISQTDRRLTQGFSNFELGITLSSDTINLDTVYNRGIGIFKISTAGNDLNNITAFSAFKKYPITILPIAGDILTINDNSTTGGNIYLETASLVLDGDKDQGAEFAQGINDSAKFIKRSAWTPITT